MSLPRKKLWQLYQRRVCVGLMLAAYLLTVAGFPVQGSAKKHGSHPFPCQDHDCGCSSAEECWTNCCCFSPAQHLAWAKEHGVEPPAYTVLPAATDSEPAHADHECARCEAPKTQDALPCPDLMAQVDDGQKTDECCLEHSHSANQEVQPSSAPGIRWAMGVNIMRCRGFSTLWVASGSVAPPPPALTWSPRWKPDGCVCLHDTDATVRLTPPLDPPPRLVKSL